MNITPMLIRSTLALSKPEVIMPWLAQSGAK